jgi:predicted amidophosphoribosyltransferase
MVKSPSWSQRSQDSKERVLKRGYDQAREIARKTLMRKYPELRARAEQTAGQ